MDYATLQTTIADWVDYDHDDVRLPTFILLAEARMNRHLETLGLTCVGHATGDGVATDFDLPADWSRGRTISVANAALTYATPAYWVSAVNKEAFSVPAIYTLDGSKIRIYAAPGEDVDIRFSYHRKVPPLTDTEPTNWVLINHPDLYVKGALTEAFLSAQDEARAQVYAQEFSRILDEIRRDEWNKRYANTGRVSR